MEKRGALKKRLALLAGVLVIGLVGGVVADAAINRSAPVSKFDGVNEIVQKCTTSSNFVQMPQMTRTFTLGGSVNDEVLVTFDGAVDLGTGGGSFDTGFVGVTIDGAQQSPGVVPLIGAGDRGSHGFTWQSKPLSPGQHTARVQWRTDLHSQFCVDARSLTVLHK